MEAGSEVAVSSRRRELVVDRLLQLSGGIFVVFSVVVVYQVLFPAVLSDLSDTGRAEVWALAGVTWAAGLLMALVGLRALRRRGSKRRWMIAVADLLVMAGVWTALLTGLSGIKATAWDEAEALAHDLGAPVLGDEVAHERTGGRSFGLGDPPTVVSTRVCKVQDPGCVDARTHLARQLRSQRFEDLGDSGYWTRRCDAGLAFVEISDAVLPTKTGDRAGLELRVAVDVGSSRCA